MQNVHRRDALKAAASAALAGALSAEAVECSAETQNERQVTAPAGPYFILSCDGGGYRGDLTALVIRQLESEQPFLDRVRLFAGTSTGAIIALGLAKGLKIDALVQLYERQGVEIFGKLQSETDSSGIPASVLDRLRALKFDPVEVFGFDFRDLLHPKYPNDGLKRVLGEHLGNDATFADLRPGVSALVTALRLADAKETGPGDKKGWLPLVLHNLSVKGSNPDSRVVDVPTPATKLVDAALSSSAAPLYFPPYEHPEYGFCVDGGLFANCPASIALAAAIRAGQPIASVSVLSIGTGAQISSIPIPSKFPFRNANDYGALAWLTPVARNGKQTPAFPLISALFDASSATHNYLCDQILDDAYHRVQITLEEPIPLDEATPEATARIHKVADALFASKEWTAVKRWLRDRLA